MSNSISTESASERISAALQRTAKRSRQTPTNQPIQNPKKGRRLFRLIIVGCIALTASYFLINAIRAGYRVNWTGFGGFTKPNPDYEKPKLLWDWLNLIIIPLVGAIALRWFSHRREQLDRESQRIRFQEEALQRYLDHMTHLVLEKELITAPHSQIHEIARYRTLTVLRQLDVDRKATLLRFLYECGLIDENNPVMNLKDADFRGINLERVKLNSANLAGADLSGAKLAGANLEFCSFTETKLYGADLAGAVLNGARFSSADLSSAVLTDAYFIEDQLLESKSWIGIMPRLLEEKLQNRGIAPKHRERIDQWLRLTDPIIHTSALWYSDDEKEAHGRWVVTRGRHVIEKVPVFSIGLYPITNAWFFKFVQDGGYMDGALWKDIPVRPESKFLCKDGKTLGPATWPSSKGFFENRGDHPVAGICYWEAVVFCRWLQAKNAFDGSRWDLPTEDMWEIVARHTPEHIYPWGDSFSADCCNSVEKGEGTTTPVNRFENGRSTRGGCYDMAGNVWEFVRESKENWYCVLRGGSFRNNQYQVKSSLRLWGVPRDHRPFDFGFRCASIREGG